MSVLHPEADQMPANGERPEAIAKTPALEGEPLLDLGGEKEAGPYEAEPSQNGAASHEDDEPLDPDLVRLFLEANAETEASMASEVPDIPIQELLNELRSLSRSLGITRPSRAETAAKQDSPGLESLPPLEAAVPSSDSVWAQALRGLVLSIRPTLAGLPRHALHDIVKVRLRLPASRRHAMHGILLSLTLVMAIASVLIGVDRMINSEQNRGLEPQMTATPPSSGVVVRQAVTVQPTLEPTPAPTREPAYFLYTVQRGNTLIDIAATFGLNLDHMLWANPEHIDDPDLLHAGDRLLIPSLEGMIYYVKPGDILSAMGRLLPAREPADSGPPVEEPEPPE